MNTLGCRVCDGEVGAPVRLREMMFRTGEEFDYGTCGQCGTLQILAFPADMSRHYPLTYYSFWNNYQYQSTWRRALKRILLSIALRRPQSRAASFFRQRAPWLLMIPGLSRSSRILDVGCGQGSLLKDLEEWGFRRLYGADPFIPTEIKQGAIHIRKQDITEIRQKFDVVMMHHSLEHVMNPRRVLEAAKACLAPGGSIVVRIPLTGGYISETYGKDWVQLDPPRHFHLFTEKSFLQLAASLGLLPRQVYYDAVEFSLRGSEAVRNGIPMADSESFSAAEMQDFQSKIDMLNAAKESDQACFVLRSA